MIVPSRLRAGDTIGIVSPASPVAAFCSKRFARGVENLEKMGFSVRVAEHATARHGHTAGTIEDRVSDIHTMFTLPNGVRARVDFCERARLQLLEEPVNKIG